MVAAKNLLAACNDFFFQPAGFFGVAGTCEIESEIVAASKGEGVVRTEDFCVVGSYLCGDTCCFIVAVCLRVVAGDLKIRTCGESRVEAVFLKVAGEAEEVRSKPAPLGALCRGERRGLVACRQGFFEESEGLLQGVLLLCCGLMLSQSSLDKFMQGEFFWDICTRGVGCVCGRFGCLGCRGFLGADFSCGCVRGSV